MVGYDRVQAAWAGEVLRPHIWETGIYRELLLLRLEGQGRIQMNDNLLEMLEDAYEINESFYPSNKDFTKWCNVSVLLERAIAILKGESA